MKHSVRRAVLLAAGLALVLAAAVAATAFWYQCGPGLEREADRLTAVSALSPGMTVADIGAGTGSLAFRVAGRVGQSGRVYATEINQSLIERIGETAAAKGITNLSTILAGEHSTGLPLNCCEVIYMRRVYHHLTDSRAILQGLHAALRPGGRLIIIDFITPSWLRVARHGIESEVVRREASGAGLILDRRIDHWSQIDYCLVFRKAESYIPGSGLAGGHEPNP